MRWNSIAEDYASEQIGMREYMDSFTGNKSKQAKQAAAHARLPVIVMRRQTSTPLVGLKPVIAPCRDAARLMVIRL